MWRFHKFTCFWKSITWLTSRKMQSAYQWICQWYFKQNRKPLAWSASFRWNHFQLCWRDFVALVWIEANLDENQNCSNHAFYLSNHCLSERKEFTLRIACRMTLTSTRPGLHWARLQSHLFLVRDFLGSERSVITLILRPVCRPVSSLPAIVTLAK